MGLQIYIAISFEFKQYIFNGFFQRDSRKFNGNEQIRKKLNKTRQYDFANVYVEHTTVCIHALARLHSGVETFPFARIQLVST